MTPTDWSWITGSASILGAGIMSHSPRWGWIYGLPLECLWTTSGIETHRWGDIAMSLFFMAMNVRALWRWHGTRFEPARKREKVVSE